MRTPGQGRYAQLEREQRWQLRAMPSGVTGPTEIYDRYLVGTRLRLRRAERDGEVVYKLAQKVRVDDRQPERVQLTNIYLSEQEYSVFAALPARELRKRRWHLEWDGRVVAIDEFAGVHAGLILAEVELAADEPRLALPPFAERDVTADDALSGGNLAS